jgi:hypothetical protein
MKLTTLVMNSIRKNNRFRFGKYKGQLYSDVIIKDPDYIKWCITNKMTLS